MLLSYSSSDCCPISWFCLKIRRNITEEYTAIREIAAKEASLMPLMVAGIFYYVFNFIVALICQKVEKHYDYYKI